MLINKYMLISLITLFCSLFIKCATINYSTKDRNRVISLFTSPPGATVYMDKDSVGITPTEIYLKDTIFGIAGHTWSRNFEFRKKNYAPSRYYLPGQYLMPKIWTCCLLFPIPCLGWAIPYRLGSLYKHQDNIEIKLLTWLDFAKLQMSKLQSKKPSVRYEATISFLDFGQDATEAIQYLIDTFPKITDKQNLVLSEQILYNPGNDFYPITPDPWIEYRGKKIEQVKIWTRKQQQSELSATISQWEETWENCISIHDYSLGNVREKTLIDRDPRTLVLIVHNLTEQKYNIHYTIHLEAKALELITGQNFGPNQQLWRQWWDENKANYINP